MAPGPTELICKSTGIGAATKSRTRDLLITNQLLYQLSYSGQGTARILRQAQAKYQGQKQPIAKNGNKRHPHPSPAPVADCLPDHS
jgi:hypothetical protein